MAVNYEWAFEITDLNNEIIDHNFFDKLSDSNGHFDRMPPGEFATLVLVRTTDDGDRQWAYVEDDKLPEYFSIPEGDGNYYETATRVPKRFHNEWAIERARRLRNA